MKLFKGRSSLAAFLMSAILILVILIPMIQVTGSIVETAKELRTGVQEGTLDVSPPPDKVKDWPVVGSTIYSVWNQASVNLQSTIQNYSDEVSNIVSTIFSKIAGLFTDVLLSIAAIAIAGVFLHFSDPIYKSIIRFFNRVTDGNGKQLTDNSRDTIKSVVKGLVLIALIQAVLSGIGFAMVGIPAAGLLAVIVMLFAIIQLPVILFMIPMIIYVFAHSETWVAIIFAVYAIIVGSLDNILKPILLGRGLKVPMPVILIGAIGGMILHGIIGLFVGPVILALAWQFIQEWMSTGESNNKEVTQ